MGAGGEKPGYPIKVLSFSHDEFFIRGLCSLIGIYFMKCEKSLSVVKMDMLCRIETAQIKKSVFDP